jgi:O-antigen ligase
MFLRSIKEKIIYYNFPVFLFSFLPLFLITGPFLADLSISLISILFLLYCLKEKDFSFFKNVYFYFFLFFWIYLILNSLLINYDLNSLKISFFYFRYAVFVIAIVTFLTFDDRFLKYFFYCIFFCFSILTIDGFYQYFVGENLLGWKKVDNFRITGLFGEEKILGSYLSRLWPIFFGLSIFFFRKKNKLFFIFILIFILSEILIFLSGDRTAFFFINLSAIFVILFSSNLLKLRLITLGSSLLLILIISYFNPTAKQRVINQTFQQMNIVQNEKKKNDQIYIFSKQHTELYVAGINIFLDNKVFGVGVKSFRNFCSDEKYKTRYSCSTHPHNFYLQILVETGVIGFSFLMIVLFYFFVNITKHFFRKLNGKILFSDFEICVLSGIIIFIWPFAPTGSIFNNWLNIISILYLPFLIWSRKSKELI